MASTSINGVVTVDEAVGVDPVKECDPAICSKDWRQRTQQYALSFSAHLQYILFAIVLRASIALRSAEALDCEATAQHVFVLVLQDVPCRQVPHGTDEREVQDAVPLAHAPVQQAQRSGLAVALPGDLPPARFPQMLDVRDELRVRRTLCNILELKPANVLQEGGEPLCALLRTCCHQQLQETKAHGAEEAIPIATDPSPSNVPMTNELIDLLAEAPVKLEILDQRAERLSWPHVDGARFRYSRRHHPFHWS
mmetsp:Transcript_40768/g.110271  ORF Transcript_40768/g.110271 Transcript_40768/m.110271 type:complete len:252 (+) Transcript_40768:416-1171(+)